MKANSLSAEDDGEQEVIIELEDDEPPRLSSRNANQSTGPREKSQLNTENSGGSIDAPVMPLRLSPDDNKSDDQIRLARSGGVEDNDGIEDDEDDEDEETLANRQDHLLSRKPEKGADVDGFFTTIDRQKREEGSMRGAMLPAPHSEVNNTMLRQKSKEDVVTASQNSIGLIINQQSMMQAMPPLETAHEHFQSTQKALVEDNNILKMVTLDGQAPTDSAINEEQSSRQANFETSQKNIFESSVDQRGSIVQPQDMVSDQTTNLNLMQTVASSGLSLVQTSQEIQHQEQQKKSYCSLFVIFGLNATEFVKNNLLKEQYDVLGSYPNLDQHPEVASEHKFVQDLRMICFPELSLKTERFKMSNMDPLCRCQFFHFISTNDMGDKKYLTSVHFKEILLCEKGAFVIDKAVCVASSQPIFSLQKQVLHQIFQKVVLQNNNVSIKAFKQAQWTYDGFLDEYDQPPPHDFPNFVYKFMMDQVMCADNRKARDRDSDCHSTSPPQTKKNAAAANSSHLPVVDFTSIMELYISIFSKHLYFDPTVERDIHIIQTDNAPAAITNAASYNSNQSMFGTTTTSANFTTTNLQSQQDQKANRHVPLFKFRNMKPFGFQLENYPFDLLLQTLKPDKLIQLVTALLLERKIVLIKREIGDIALIMQSLITLLSPFQWHFTIITYLTRELVDMLDAPFPFMIGVSWATWDSICLTKDYAEEIFIFDLESQERRYITKQEVPELPSPFGDDLLAGLKDVMDKKDRRLAALRAENKHSKSKSLSKRQLDQQFDEQYWADAQLSVKQLFFNFLLMTVNNYIQFYRTNEEQKELDDEAEKGAANTWNYKSSEDFFDFQGYIEWQDDKQMERTGENNLFMREFVKTQAFHEFIEQNRNTENEGAENAAVFFESCIELLTESTERNRESEKVSWKKLKSAQQEMIDQAKYNLATPVKFKFNGIYSKYVEGLRKREQHVRSYLEELQPVGQSRERKFSELSEADQVDDIIMKYIFMRPEAPDSFRQYSLVADVNQDMVFERIPKIRYDLVELYWQKMYKTKSPGVVVPEASGKQSHRSIENPPQTMHVNKPANMQRRKKRLSNKNELEYEEYINNGNQVSHAAEHYSDTGSQHSNMKKLIKKHNSNQQLIKKNRSGNNIIHDYPETTSQTGSMNNQNAIEYVQSNAIEPQNATELKSKNFERQAQSTRNFASLSVQKGTQRSSYNVKSYYHYTSNKGWTDQLRIGQTGKGKKSQDSFQEGFVSLNGQPLRQTRSPKVTSLAKSTTMSITRTAVANTLLQSGKSSGLLSSQRTNNKLAGGANIPGGSSKPSPASSSNAAALTAIKTTRNKSHQSASLLKQQQQMMQQQQAQTSRHQTKHGAAANFQEKVRAARQRGSIQYMPERQQQQQQQVVGDGGHQPASQVQQYAGAAQNETNMLQQVEVIERQEQCSNNADDFVKIGDGMDSGFDDHYQNVTQRMKQNSFPKHKLTTNVSARQISPNPPQLLEQQTFAIATGGTANKAFMKQGKLTSSLTSLSHVKAAQRRAGIGAQADIQANKPADRKQSFLVKGSKQGVGGGLRDTSKNDQMKRPKLTALTNNIHAPQQTSSTPGNGTSRQHKMLHPAFSHNNNSNSNNQHSKQTAAAPSGNNPKAAPSQMVAASASSNSNINHHHHHNGVGGGGYSLDTIIPGRKSHLKNKQQSQQMQEQLHQIQMRQKMLENPTIELLDGSSGSFVAGGGAAGADQSSGASGIVMPEYTEKKAVTNTAATATAASAGAANTSSNQQQQQRTMTQLAQSIQSNSNKLVNQRNNNRGPGGAVGAQGGGPTGLSKVLRISYELPQSKNSFINIEKEEAEGTYGLEDQVIQQDSSYDAIFPPVRQAPSASGGGSSQLHAADSSLMKDADKTELQDFTKQPIGMAVQQELQGGGRAHHQNHPDKQQQQSDSQGSQGGGSILEIDPPPNKNLPPSQQMMVGAAKVDHPASLPSKSALQEADQQDGQEDLNVYQSTDGIGDGVNEMIEDEAHMAQKTAYYLQYRTKFNKINSESQIKMQGSSLSSSNNNGQLVRKQMMPSNSSISAVLSRDQQSNKIANFHQGGGSQSNFNNQLRQSDNDLSGSSASHNQLAHQLSGCSSDNKLSSLLQGKATQQNPTQQQSEKQNLRKVGPSMPLSMLLTKTNSRPAKRQPGGGSKTRSITDKQFSFQEIARMPSHSMVHQPPKVKSGNNLDDNNCPPSMLGIQPKSSRQQEMSIPMPTSHPTTDSNNHFHRDCLEAGVGDDDDAAAADLEHDDEGWFTPIESKRLSQAGCFPNQPLVSDETKQKLQRFYSDIDGSFMDPPPATTTAHLLQHNSSSSMQQQAAIMVGKQYPQSYSSSSRLLAQANHNNNNNNSNNNNTTPSSVNPKSISRQQQQLFKKPSQMQPPQQLIDSPQQSTSRKSGSSVGAAAGKHPGRTALPPAASTKLAEGGNGSTATAVDEPVCEGEEEIKEGGVVVMGQAAGKLGSQGAMTPPNNGAVGLGAQESHQDHYLWQQQHQQQNQQQSSASGSIIDNSIAAPNNGILFSHQKRRTERYRDDL